MSPRRAGYGPGRWMTEVPDQPAVSCLRCKKPAELLGSVPLVTSGRSPATKLFFTSLAVASEQSWTITAYRCTYCGHLELFDLSVVNASLPATGPVSAP